MAMTPLERKRLSLARKVERERLAGDPTDKIAKRSFNEFVQSEQDFFDNAVLYPLEWSGISPDCVPVFDNDDDPEWREEDGPNRGSIGRAERMAAMLLDAANGLAGVINAYKREEIDHALGRLESTDLTVPAVRKQAVADMVRLNRIREQLDKQVRRTLPQWEVKGD